jgi:hypothetical protein
MALTLDQGIGQGMNFGTWFNQLGANGPALLTSANPTWGQATNTWDQFRQGNVNMANAMNVPGSTPLTYSSGDYSTIPANATQHAMSAPSASTGSGYGMSSNPYLGGQAQGIVSRTFNDYLNPALQQINSGAVATGGLGGSRQGVAQGEAIAHGMDYLSGNLANLYGNDWNQEQNRGLEQYGMDQNFYTSQRGQDLQQLGVAGNLYGLGTSGQWLPYQNYSQTLSPYTGFGTTSSTGQQGGGAVGSFGGALAGASIGNKLGWW